MKCLLTRRANGCYYLLTKFAPELARVGSSQVHDAYAIPGDPLNVQICQHVANLWGVETRPLQTQTINIQVRCVGEPSNLPRSEAKDEVRSTNCGEHYG